jgi:hypothetical protein
MSNLTELCVQDVQRFLYWCKEPEHIPGWKRQPREFFTALWPTFQAHPDLVLIWVNGRQAMLLEEALGTVCWDKMEHADALDGPPAGLWRFQ